jgi:hypothetical protein
MAAACTLALAVAPSRVAYRKPSPSDPRPSKGVTVRRPDDPVEDDSAQRARTGADPRKQAAYRAQSAAIAAQLEYSQRRAAITTRVGGGAMLGLVVLMTWLDVHRLDTTGLMHVPGSRERVLYGLLVSFGAWMLAFGAGGAPDPRHAPDWWRWGAAVAAIFGVGFGISGTMHAMLAAFVRLFV